MLGIVSISNGQGPIQPYNENGYSISQVETFALSGSVLADNWRKELLSIVNSGLVSAGIEIETLDQRHISWIFDHVKYEVVTLTNFINSKKVGVGGISFFLDRNTFTGQVGVFEYNGLRIILFKTICMNLLKIHAEKRVIQKDPTPTPTPTVTPPAPVPVPPAKVESDGPVTWTPPRNLTQAVLDMPVSTPSPQLPKVKFNWKPVLIIGGVAVTASLGYLAYTLLKSKPVTQDPGGPVDPPGGNTDPGGPVDPVGP